MKSEKTNPEAATPEAEVRVLKIASCPSVTGKSTLTYHVGCTADSDIHFRISSNSASGAFSQAWVSLRAVQLAVSMNDKTITSRLLFPLYQGTSINTPAFLLAALKNEGLVKPSTTKRRCHEWVDDAPFIAEMQAWAASGKEPKAEARSTEGSPKPKKGRGKLAKGADQLQPAEVKPDGPPKLMAKVTPLKRAGKKIEVNADAPTKIDPKSEPVQSREVEGAKGGDDQ